MKKSCFMLICLLAFIMVLSGCDYLGYFDSADGGRNNGSGNGSGGTSTSYTISFDANGGTGTMSSATVEDGSSYTIPASGFSGPSGTMRRFAGWNTAADGGGTAYSASDVATINADTTLYAQWTKPLFSVAADRKVYFSRGNLWFDGTSTWSFETNQYDSTPAADVSWNTSHISHFFWSKTTSKAYASSWSLGSDADTDVLFTNDPSDSKKPNPDFTVNGQQGVWRSLYYEELNYLCNTRTVNGSTGAGYSYVNNSSGISIGGNTYYGVFLFPDDYTGTTDMSTLTWSQINDAGIVFFPLAGYRGGDYISNFGIIGYYWTSSCTDMYSARTPFFADGVMNPSYIDSRSNGCPIRMVVEE